MSLKKINLDELGKLPPEGLLIAIDNGDLKALQEIVEKWGFIDAESALRFALGVLLLSAESKGISVTREGSDKRISPVDSLLKPKESSKPGVNAEHGKTA